MKTLGKTLFGATAATALAVASAAPAQARDGDGIDGGDILTGALILGGIAAIAAIASDGDDDRYDDRYRGRTRGYDPGYYHGGRLGPQQAVQQCSAAAVRDASRYGPGARVTQITDVDRDRDGYEIEGRVAVRDHYRGNRWDNRWNRGAQFDEGRFSCRIRYGRIDRLRVRGLG